MGAAFIGVVVAASLWGVSCMQVWYYYETYLKDPWQLKLLVAAVLTFDTIHQLLITHTIYIYLVSNFAIVVDLGKIVWSLIVEVLFNGFTALLVQCFMTSRIWRLSNKNYLLTGTVFALVIAEFVCVIIYVVKALQITTFVELTALKHLSMVVNVLAAAGDVLIAIVLCIMLQKSRTGFKRTDTMIKKLIIFTMNTGLTTSICAVASLISIIAAPTSFIYIAFYFNLGRCYTNSFMVTLNVRQRILCSTVDQMMSFSSPGIPQNSSTALTNNISIKVDTTRETVRDHHKSAQEGFTTEPDKIDLKRMLI